MRRAVAPTIAALVVATVPACTSPDDATPPTATTDTTTTTAAAAPATTLPTATTTTTTTTTITTTTTSTTAAPAPTDTTTTTTGTTTTSTTVAPEPPPPVDGLGDVMLGIELVADVWEPTAMAWRDGDDGLYIGLQGGQVHRLANHELTLTIDLSDETTVVEPGSERGLLGIAFDPRDGRLFVNYTGRDDDTRVASFQVHDGVADPGSRRDVLFIEQPGIGHNGGRLVFDADGHLFIGSGDGGGSNGRDAQDPTKLLGAILRVVPDLDGDGYDIPADNPYADGVADRPEVWVRGLRNPWGFSLDEPTGDLWIGDVGDDRLEEINVAPAGAGGLNFGWYFFEGSHRRFADAPDGLTPPVHDYPRSDGVAVMGGHVYRGSAIPELAGAYLFGDLTGAVWAMGADHAVVRLDVEPVRTMVGWGEDPAGELYLFSLYDGVYRLVPRSP